MTQHFIAFVCEFAWRADWHAAHLSMDSSSQRRSVAVREIIGIAAYAHSIDVDGALSIDALASWNQRDWGGEAEVVEQFFDFVRRRPDHTALGYGSIATDLPVLRLAAMTSGLRLPGQLIDQPGTWDRRHLDLALAIKGRGRTWVHLSQLLIRIGVPLTLLAAKADAPLPDSPEDWSNLRDHVELDTLLLALAHVSWLVSSGSPGVRYAPAAIAHLSAFLRRRPEHALASELMGYQRQLEAEMAERYRDAA